jgi:hypothetical protein
LPVLVLADEQIMSALTLLVWKGRAEIVIEEHVIQVRSKHRLKVFRNALCSCGLTAMHDWWMDDSDHQDQESKQDTRWIQVLKPKAGRDVWKDDKESRYQRLQEGQTETIMAAVNKIQEHVRELDKRMEKQAMQDVASRLVHMHRAGKGDQESNTPPGLQPAQSKAGAAGR